MKLASVMIDGTTSVAFSEDGVNWKVLLSQSSRPLPRSLKQLMRQYHSRGSIERLLAAGTEFQFGDLKFLPPVLAPEKIFCIGKNYSDHAREMGGEVMDLPVVFNKLPSSLIGHDDQIRLPTISEQVDFEAELVAIIGKSGRNIPLGSALEHVFGYTIGNDVTARDWQKGSPGGQWLLGKTFDTFAPVGPYVVTSDELADPNHLAIELRLNDRIMQNGNTKDLVFSIDFLIHHLSKFVTLRPGDLLFTGTPSGVGAGRQPPVFLKSGDELEIRISQIGILKNRVASD